MMRGAGLTETATATCEATTRSGVGCKNAALPGGPWCHGHHPDRAEDRVRIASAGGRARSRPTTENAFTLGEAEQRARDKAVAQANFRAGGLDTLISTRARQLKDDPPPPDLQRSQDAIRRAETRRAWAEWHRGQADRHRRTLTDLVSHHEEQAERLEGVM
jgi:DNA-directed RNA polymerase subunit K/omega